MSCWALVPMKARAEAKSRLAAVLAPAVRQALVRTMLDNVLDVLSEAPGIDHVAVVSPERDTVPDDIPVLADPGRGLNRALDHAVAALKGMGARAVLIIPGDLPFLTVTDVVALLEGMHTAGCALASDERGSGTNALALDLERLRTVAFRFLFGRNSFARHSRQARLRGLGPRVIASHGLVFDLDEPAAFNTLNDTIAQAVAMSEAL